MALNYNEQLGRAFELFRDTLIESVNSAPLVEHLFTGGALDETERDELAGIAGRSAKTNRLLSILFAERRPQIYVKLRNALKATEANRWLIDEIDRHARPRQGKVYESSNCVAVVNVAVLDDLVFVVDELSDRIRVFDARSTPSEELDEIRVDGLKWPTDLSVCTISGKLFVADSFYFNKCVWQIDIASWPWKTSVRKIRTSFRPWSLSVTSRRLLVTPIGRRDFRIQDSVVVADDGRENTKANKRVEFPIEMDVQSIQEKKKNALYLYNVSGETRTDVDDGYLIKRIILPSDLESHMIHHAVEMVTGTFVVCHSGNADVSDVGVPDLSHLDDSQLVDRVSEVDDSGRVIRSYGGLRGSGPQQFHWPNHLALALSGTTDRLSLLVVDRNNCRVVVLDDELRYEHILLNKDFDRMSGNPWHLSYSPTTGRLVIALENGSVYEYY